MLSQLEGEALSKRESPLIYLSVATTAYYALVVPRSGLAKSAGIDVGARVIDSDYQLGTCQPTAPKVLDSQHKAPWDHVVS